MVGVRPGWGGVRVGLGWGEGYVVGERDWQGWRGG